MKTNSLPKVLMLSAALMVLSAGAGFTTFAERKHDKTEASKPAAKSDKTDSLSPTPIADDSPIDPVKSDKGKDNGQKKNDNGKKRRDK